MKVKNKSYLYKWQKILAEKILILHLKFKLYQLKKRTFHSFLKVTPAMLQEWKTKIWLKSNAQKKQNLKSGYEKIKKGYG